MRRRSQAEVRMEEAAGTTVYTYCRLGGSVHGPQTASFVVTAQYTQARRWVDATNRRGIAAVEGVFASHRKEEPKPLAVLVSLSLSLSS